MSYRAQVTSTPQQLAFGSQKENITLTNVGANTVYLANDSSVTAGSDLVLDAGGSILVEPNTVIWGVTGSGLTSQVSVVAQVGERFAYSNQAYKIITQYSVTDLGPGSGTGNLQTGKITFDNSFSTQYAAIGIFISNNVATNVSFKWTGSIGTQATPPEYVMVRGGTGGSATIGAIFPVQSFGGTWLIQPDALVGNSNITVVGYPLAIYPYPIALSDAKNLNSVWNGASGSWTYFQSSFASSTTSFLYLPAITGSARVVMNYTQAGPGTLTTTPQIARTVNGLYWTASYLQYDTAVTTSTAATQFVAFNWSNVSPTPLRLQITSDAVASLTNLYVSVDQNK